MLKLIQRTNYCTYLIIIKPYSKKNNHFISRLKAKMTPSPSPKTPVCSKRGLFIPALEKRYYSYGDGKR